MSDHLPDGVPPADVDLTKPQPEPQHPARTLGAYRLLQLVGQGGMGEVWLAEQTHPVRRQVALKVIKAGMDTAQVVSRFEAERQALALMDHPAIATVYDAGSTPEGRPYFAMEYVKGEPITSYCDRQRLTTHARLELFMQVCEGVQHAHQKGIIHRDLKPSNVLVTIQDERPVPKIIDFGVAKATAQHLTERTLYTELGVMIGTPEYMSPEQAEMGGLDIDTRTDIYALGVILYELLTGVLPFERKELRESGFAEIQRTIREKEPPKPSTRITHRGPASAEAAAKRHTEPRRLASELRGDLDWVTMKALEKDRTRRYQTANALAADVRRHLAHEPVSAGPPSVAYRARKFARRHRFGVAVAGAAGLAVIAFAAAMAVQAQRIAVERDRANREAETSRRVSDFLVGLFEVSKPSEKKANSITAREILDTAAARIRQELDGQPAVQATLLGTIGDAYFSLGLYRQADEHQQQALALQRQLHGPMSPEVSASLVELSATLEEEGRTDDAERLAREALGILSKRSGMQEPTADAQVALAWVLNRKGNFAEAERVAREACRTYREVPGISERKLAMCAAALGGILYEKADLHGAEQAFSEALERLRRTRGAEHPRTISAAGNLATVWLAQRNYDRAEAAYREILRLEHLQLGADHPDLAADFNNLGAVLYFQGKYAEAEASYREAMRIASLALGDTHPAVALYLKNIGQALTLQRKYPEAENALRQALVIDRSARGHDHPKVALTLTFLADCQCRAGELQEAEAAAREALAINAARLGKDHPRFKESEGALGCALARQRRYAEAEPLLLDYSAALQAGIGAEGDPAQLAQLLVAMYMGWNKPDKAAEWRAKLPKPAAPAPVR